MSYQKQYMEKRERSLSPDRKPHQDISDKLKLDLSRIEDEAPEKSAFSDSYTMDFELSDNLQSGDDKITSIKLKQSTDTPTDALSPPEKSPSKSKIPLPNAKRFTSPSPATATPPSSNTHKLGIAALGQKLEKRLRLKEAQITRLEYELSSLRENLVVSIKKSTDSSREVMSLRAETKKLEDSLKESECQNKLLQKRLDTLNIEKSAMEKSLRVRTHTTQASKSRKARNLIVLIATLPVIAWAAFTFYTKYQQQLVEQQQKSDRWFHYF